MLGNAGDITAHEILNVKRNLDLTQSESASGSKDLLTKLNTPLDAGRSDSRMTGKPEVTAT
jgi:hypothetical protein